MKKRIVNLLILSLFVVTFGGIASASELYISPDQGDFGKNCVIKFDIIASTMGDKIMGTDLMIDSSMDFVDFVPSDVFDYYLPPKVMENGIISLGAFSNPDNLLQGELNIGTLYLKSNEVNTDGYVRFYFKGEGDTADTNLSAKGGIDTLKKIHNGVYTFNGDPCLEEVHNIDGGIAGKDYDQAIGDLVDKLEQKGKWQNVISFLKSKNFLLLLGIIIIFVVLFIVKNRGRNK